MPTCADTLLGGDDEVDQIPPALIQGLSAGGMLVVLFWMLARDHLITGPAHRRELDAKDAQMTALEKVHEQRVADKDAQVVMWRAVGETAQAQMVELLEHSRFTVQLLQAIEQRAKEQATRQTGD